MIKNMYLQLKRLYSFARPACVILVLGVTGNAINRLLGTIMTANLFSDATRALTGNDTVRLIDVIYNALPFALIITVISAFSTYFTSRANSISTSYMRKKLMQQMVEMPLNKMNEQQSGNMLSYMTNDIPTATSALSSSLEIVLIALIQGVGSFIYVFFASRLLIIYVIILGILTLIYSVFLAKKMYKVSVIVQKQKAEMLINLKKLLDGTVVSKIYNMRALLYYRFDESANKAMHTGIKWARLSGVLGSINNFASHFSKNFLMFLAGLLLFSNKLDVPTVLWVSQMGLGVVSIFHISRRLAPILQSLAGAQRVFDAMDSIESEVGGQKYAKEDYSNNAIEFKNVSFGYIKDSNILNNLSFKIDKGEIVAIIGQSGSGKTTLFRLIQSLYQPSNGSISVFGLNTEKWNLKKLRNIISLVTQDNTLLTGTIIDNITLGNPIFTKDDIIRVSKLAGAHDFIIKLPDEYNTVVNERGSSLSGGEKQRISIARALLRDAPIILLDEPTSALDSESESIIAQTLQRLKGQKTIIIVAHKPQTIEIADRIIELTI